MCDMAALYDPNLLPITVSKTSSMTIFSSSALVNSVSSIMTTDYSSYTIASKMNSISSDLTKSLNSSIISDIFSVQESNATTLAYSTKRTATTIYQLSIKPQTSKTLERTQTSVGTIYRSSLMDSTTHEHAEIVALSSQTTSVSATEISSTAIATISTSKTYTGTHLTNTHLFVKTHENIDKSTFQTLILNNDATIKVSKLKTISTISLLKTKSKFMRIISTMPASQIESDQSYSTIPILQNQDANTTSSNTGIIIAILVGISAIIFAIVGIKRYKAYRDGQKMLKTTIKVILYLFRC
eukprot:NODE_360_length_10152_cov_0.555556.p1 type:complete len:298 gc:universal NODE_360_length_10152_cov_0.555556:5382-6275(+)